MEEQVSVLALCPYCQSEDVVKNGTKVTGGRIVQRYKCLMCQRYFSVVETECKSDLDALLELAMQQKLRENSQEGLVCPEEIWHDEHININK